MFNMLCYSTKRFWEPSVTKSYTPSHPQDQSLDKTIAHETIDVPISSLKGSPRRCSYRSWAMTIQTFWNLRCLVRSNSCVLGTIRDILLSKWSGDRVILFKGWQSTPLKAEKGQRKYLWRLRRFWLPSSFIISWVTLRTEFAVLRAKQCLSAILAFG